MSRGLANCNPGNIRRSSCRYRGEVRPSRDPAFKQFESLEWGYRAIFVTLRTYSRKYGLKNLRGMITRWAPPSENSTEAYIRAVADRTGLRPDAVIDIDSKEQMIPLVAAMSEVENGTQADFRTIEHGWELYTGEERAKSEEEREDKRVLKAAKGY